MKPVYVHKVELDHELTIHAQKGLLSICDK